MENSINRINYVDSECLQVTFSYIIIRVKSINENFGQLSKFADENDLYGTTNGKLYILEEMVEPHQRILDLVTNVLKPLNLQANEDYVLGYEQLVHGAKGYISPYLDKDIPDLTGINWLGSIIKRNGNFVWNREVDNWDSYSEPRQKVHADKLAFEPKVNKGRNENDVFGSSSEEYELIEFNPDIPLVIKGFKKLGVVEISGKAVFNNPNEGDKLINTPVIEWVENYLKTAKPICIKFFLESLNIFSAHPMLTVFKRLAELNEIHNSIQINWYYSIDNEAILEAGNDHSEIANLPFNFIVI